MKQNRKKKKKKGMPAYGRMPSRRRKTLRHKMLGRALTNVKEKKKKETGRRKGSNFLVGTKTRNQKEGKKKTHNPSLSL